MTLLFKIGFLNFNWIDAIDILLVAFLLYRVYKLLRGSVAVNIFLGVLSIYLFYLLVRALDMVLVSKILGQFIGVGVIASIILFLDFADFTLLSLLLLVWHLLSLPLHSLFLLTVLLLT